MTRKPHEKRHKHDHYTTPYELVRASLTYVQRNPQYWGARTRILDVGADTGIWGEWSKARWGDNVFVTGIEIRSLQQPKWYDNWNIGNYLEWRVGRTFDLITGNPPFNIAEDVVRKSWDMLDQHGEMLFLFPIGFLAGQDRGEGLWKDIPPTKVIICSRRPSFKNQGGTDSMEYCLYYWDKHLYNDYNVVIPELGWLQWDYDPETKERWKREKAEKRKLKIPA